MERGFDAVPGRRLVGVEAARAGSGFQIGSVRFLRSVVGSCSVAMGAVCQIALLHVCWDFDKRLPMSAVKGMTGSHDMHESPNARQY